MQIDQWILLRLEIVSMSKNMKDFVGHKARCFQMLIITTFFGAIPIDSAGLSM